MGFDDHRFSRSSAPAENTSDEQAFRSSGIGRGSSSGTTPEQIFVSWHCTHNTVETPTILVTTNSRSDRKDPP